MGFWNVVVVVLLLFIQLSFAEDKPTQYNIPEKLVPGPNDPVLMGGTVYPEYGAPCTNYTYITIYRDNEGRAPEYVRINFNNQWHDMKVLQGTDYKTGVTYGYSFVPTALKANFYYFEASNGLGKARAAIIDSPNNGPQLFSGAFENNAAYVFDSDTGALKWSFPTGEWWVAKVALSHDAGLIVAKTSTRLYAFSKEGKSLWNFSEAGAKDKNEDVAGDVALSRKGEVVALVQDSALYVLNGTTGEQLWKQEFSMNAISVDISDDGKWAAVGMGMGSASEDADEVKMFDLAGKKQLWAYKTTSYIEDVDLTPDGKYLAAASGCPDRRAYIFARESNATLMKSEMLTRDSPGKHVKISDDGAYAAYSFDGEQGKPNIFYFARGSSSPRWSYAPEGVDARSLGMSANGGKIAAGTSAGMLYAFGSSGSMLWNYDADRRVGAMDVSRDGAKVAAGTTGKRIMVFAAGSGSRSWSYDASEWVDTIAFSGDGKLLAAGTGAIGYFFETEMAENQDAQWSCTSIKNPDISNALGGQDGGGNDGGSPVNAYCGNSKCEPNGGENSETCPNDCKLSGNDNPDILDNRSDCVKQVPKEERGKFVMETVPCDYDGPV
ncbi:MAG: PQQ-binding-like beta-propeller repeat protein, partial [Candidatus Micrarchaeia archaeon]